MGSCFSSSANAPATPKGTVSDYTTTPLEEDFSNTGPMAQETTELTEASNKIASRLATTPVNTLKRLGMNQPKTVKNITAVEMYTSKKERLQTFVDKHETIQHGITVLLVTHNKSFAERDKLKKLIRCAHITSMNIAELRSQVRDARRNTELKIEEDKLCFINRHIAILKGQLKDAR